MSPDNSSAPPEGNQPSQSERAEPPKRPDRWMFLAVLGTGSVLVLAAHVSAADLATITTALGALYGVFRGGQGPRQ